LPGKPWRERSIENFLVIVFGEYGDPVFVRKSLSVRSANRTLRPDLPDVPAQHTQARSVERDDAFRAPLGLVDDDQPGFRVDVVRSVVSVLIEAISLARHPVAHANTTRA